MNERASRLIQAMNLNEHEAVLVHNPSNMFYLSGYTGEGLVLIAGKVQAIVTDFRYTEQAEKQAELRNAALLVEDLLNEPPAFTVKDLAINGRDLISLGIKPSPAMGELLATLLAEVQDETLQNTKEALLARVQQLVTP